MFWNGRMPSGIKSKQHHSTNEPKYPSIIHQGKPFLNLVFSCYIHSKARFQCTIPLQFSGFVILFGFLLFWDHTRQCSGLSPDSLLRGQSRWCQGDHLWLWLLNETGCALTPVLVLQPTLLFSFTASLRDHFIPGLRTANEIGVKILRSRLFLLSLLFQNCSECWMVRQTDSWPESKCQFGVFECEDEEGLQKCPWISLDFWSN